MICCDFDSIVYLFDEITLIQLYICLFDDVCYICLFFFIYMHMVLESYGAKSMNGRLELHKNRFLQASASCEDFSLIGTLTESSATPI